MRGFGVLLLCFFCAFGIFSLTPKAFAQPTIPFNPPLDFTPDIGDVSSSAQDEGSTQISDVLFTIINFMRYFAGILALIWFIWSGIRLVTAGDKEDLAKEAIKGMTYGAIALILIVLLEPLITRMLFGGQGFDPGEQLLDSAHILQAVGAGKLEIMGLIKWAEALAVFLGVGFLILSAWNFLRDVGGEDEMEKQKKVLFAIALGFLILAIDQVIVDQVLFKYVLRDAITQSGITVVKAAFQQDAVRGIQEIVGIVKYFLQFLAVIAVAVMIYAGFLMITSFSGDENYEKGKKILKGTAVGFVIILLSYIMIQSLITGSIL